VIARYSINFCALFATIKKNFATNNAFKKFFSFIYRTLILKKGKQIRQSKKKKILFRFWLSAKMMRTYTFPEVEKRVLLETKMKKSKDEDTKKSMIAT
jgi:hypothetical protein